MGRRSRVRKCGALSQEVTKFSEVMKNIDNLYSLGKRCGPRIQGACDYEFGNTLVVDLIFKEGSDYENGNALVVDLVFNDLREYKNARGIAKREKVPWGRNALVVDLIFKEGSDYENGNALVVRTVFEKLNDIAIFTPDISFEVR